MKKTLAALEALLFFIGITGPRFNQRRGFCAEERGQGNAGLPRKGRIKRMRTVDIIVREQILVE